MSIMSQSNGKASLEKILQQYVIHENDAAGTAYCAASANSMKQTSCIKAVKGLTQ